MTEKYLKIRKIISNVIIVCVLIFIDQISKQWAVDALMNQADKTILGEWLTFSYLENRGAAWGMMSGARYFFLLITVVIVGILAYILYRIPLHRRMLPLRCVALLLGAGAIGNFIDRLVLGYVRDFIYIKAINFPVFNVADMYVTVSVFVLVILILFVYKEEEFQFLWKVKDNNHEEQ